MQKHEGETTDLFVSSGNFEEELSIFGDSCKPNLRDALYFGWMAAEPRGVKVGLRQITFFQKVLESE
jgi:hypothetical protein